MNKIAAFPLDLVLLPNELVALHLYEERYLQLVEDYQNGSPFIIVYKDADKITNYGSLVKIDQLAERFPDGTMDIIIKGINGVIIDKFYEVMEGDKLYPFVEGNVIYRNGDISPKVKDAFKICLDKMGKSIASKKEEKMDLFYIAHRIGLDNSHKKEMMLLKDNKEMNAYLYHQIKFIKCCFDQEEKLKSKFHLN